MPWRHLPPASRSPRREQNCAGRNRALIFTFDLLWRTYGEDATILAMARHRSSRANEAVLSADELDELQQQLDALDGPAVEEFYRTAHHRCTLQPKWLPSPRAVQELVQAWKRLRKGR